RLLTERAPRRPQCENASKPQSILACDELEHVRPNPTTASSSAVSVCRSECRSRRQPSRLNGAMRASHILACPSASCGVFEHPPPPGKRSLSTIQIASH